MISNKKASFKKVYRLSLLLQMKEVAKNITPTLTRRKGQIIYKVIIILERIGELSCKATKSVEHQRERNLSKVRWNPQIVSHLSKHRRKRWLSDKQLRRNELKF